MNNVKIQPVLVGGDINCYSVARAYHEAYGVKSIAFGKIRIGATNHSKIIDYREGTTIEDEEGFIKKLLDLADELAEPNKVFIIHRLDKDTSGILMLAKNEKIKNMFQKDWNNIVIERKYYAIVEVKMN